MRRALTTFLLSTPFAACILGSWAWFNVGLPDTLRSTRSSQPRIWLSPQTNIPDYIFTPEPVSDAVKKTLGTTNIFSGTFCKIGGGENQRSEASNQKPELISGFRPLTSGTQRSSLAAERVTVFLASWPAGSGKCLESILHTPDICWSGSGWKPIKLGQHGRVDIEIPVSRQQSSTNNVQRFRRDSGIHSKISLPPSNNSHILAFDFRIFESFEQASCEAAVWCALAGKQPAIGTQPWGNELAHERVTPIFLSSRIDQMKRLFKAIALEPRYRDGSQFVRYSLPADLDVKTSIQALHAFGLEWLRTESF